MCTYTYIYIYKYIHISAARTCALYIYICNMAHLRDIHMHVDNHHCQVHCHEKCHHIPIISPSNHMMSHGKQQKNYAIPNRPIYWLVDRYPYCGL